MAKKWVISEDELALGHVDWHKDLGIHPTEVLGGGSWEIIGGTLVLFDTSSQFGQATEEQLLNVRRNGLYDPNLEDLVWKFTTAMSGGIAYKFGKEII